MFSHSFGSFAWSSVLGGESFSSNELVALFWSGGGAFL